jgi:hypothetical protein
MNTTFRTGEITDSSITTFPCIGILSAENIKSINHQLAILFSESAKGIVLHAKETPWLFGEYCDRWDMSQFRKMQPDEQIIISG